MNVPPDQNTIKAAKAAKRKEQLIGLLVMFGGAALCIFIAWIVSLNPNGAVSRVIIYGIVGFSIVMFVFGRSIMRIINRKLNR